MGGFITDVRIENLNWKKMEKLPGFKKDIETFWCLCYPSKRSLLSLPNFCNCTIRRLTHLKSACDVSLIDSWENKFASKARKSQACPEVHGLVLTRCLSFGMPEQFNNINRRRPLFFSLLTTFVAWFLPLFDLIITNWVSTRLKLLKIYITAIIHDQ